MPKKKKAPELMSRTTPGHVMKLRAWLVELLMIRANGSLYPEFWKSYKYKWPFVNETKAISKFIKTYGETAVAKVLLENNNVKSASDYALMEYLLQNEKARLVRLATPKDVTSLPTQEKEQAIDLRGRRETKKKLGLFESLTQLENTNAA